MRLSTCLDANNDFDRCRERAKDAYDSVPRYPLLSPNGACARRPGMAPRLCAGLPRAMDTGWFQTIGIGSDATRSTKRLVCSDRNVERRSYWKRLACPKCSDSEPTYDRRAVP